METTTPRVTAAPSAGTIVFVVTDLVLGGAEIQVVLLATHLKARGWRVGVVSLMEPQTLTDELARAGIGLACLGLRPGLPDPRAISRLAAVYRRWRPDIVHSHLVHANLLARATRAFVGVPVLICSAHNVYEGGRRREIAYKLTDCLCDLTTNVSQAAVERYVRVGAVPAHRIRVMANGIDTTIYRPDSEARLRVRREMGLQESFVWLGVGRLELAKDPITLIRALSALVATSPKAVLVLAGQGTLSDRIEREAADLGVEDRVRLLGLRRDVPELMSAADAFVMSSIWEGMPLVLLEASACALPVVATNVGGNAEVVLDGRTGLLVEPGHPDLLARRMSSMMALSEDRRARMGEAGREFVVRHHSLGRTVQDWEALYRELLARRRGRVPDSQCPDAVSVGSEPPAQSRSSPRT